MESAEPQQKSQKWLSLLSMTMVYIVGELSHFLLGVVTTPMSQDIHYGDHGCLANPEAFDYEQEAKVNCYIANNSDSCAALGSIDGKNTSLCVWDYSGLGLDYQLLAGPAYIAVFTVSGVFIAIISDRSNRQIVVLVTLAILTLATVLCGIATAFWHLVIFRMLIGAGESAFSPACSSIISDIFAKETQGLALGIFNWGIYFGYGISYTVGNYVTAANVLDTGWRFSYFVAGILGVFAFICLLLFVREPKRTGDYSTQEHTSLDQLQTTKYDSVSSLNRIGDENKTPSDKSIKSIMHNVLKGESGLFMVMKAFLNAPVLMLCLAACVRHSAGFTWAYNTQLYFSTYYPSYNLGAWISAVSIGGGTVGVAIGGFVSDRLVKKLGLKARLYVLAGSQLLATPFAVGVLYLSPPWAFLSLLGSYLFAEMWIGVLFAVILELFPAKFHSTAIAIFLFVMNNVGGNVPVLVTPIRKMLNSYRTTLLIMYPGNYLLCSIIFFLTSFTL